MLSFIIIINFIFFMPISVGWQKFWCIVRDMRVGKYSIIIIIILSVSEKKAEIGLGWIHEEDGWLTIMG